jgi:hypothetical protein
MKTTKIKVNRSIFKEKGPIYYGKKENIYASLKPLEKENPNKHWVYRRT